MDQTMVYDKCVKDANGYGFPDVSAANPDSGSDDDGATRTARLAGTVALCRSRSSGPGLLLLLLFLLRVNQWQAAGTVTGGTVTVTARFESDSAPPGRRASLSQLELLAARSADESSDGPHHHNDSSSSLSLSWGSDSGGTWQAWATATVTAGAGQLGLVK